MFLLHAGSAAAAAAAAAAIVQCRRTLLWRTTTTSSIMTRIHHYHRYHHRLLCTTVNSNSNDGCSVCDDDGLQGSCPTYTRHLIVLTPNASWPSHVSDMSPLLQSLCASVTAIGQQCSTKVSAATATATASVSKLQSSSSSSLEIADVLSYPEQLLYRNISEKEVPAMLAGGLSGEPIDPKERFVLVCAHAERDHRCGEFGPRAAEALQCSIDRLINNGSETASKTKVLLSSHVGGHKYAPNVLVYPEGHWYGRVTDEHVDALAKCALSGKIYEPLYRGLGLIPHEDAAPVSTNVESSPDRIPFRFVNRDGSISEVSGITGNSVLDVVHEFGIDIEGACGGCASCGTCHVVLENKVFESLPNAEDDELDMLDYIEQDGLASPTSRLGCQIVINETLRNATLKLPQKFSRC